MEDGRIKLKEVTQWLLDNGYAYIVNQSFTLAKKFSDDLGLKPITVEPITATSPPKLLPNILSKLTNKEIWNQFCLDAEVPFRVINPRGERYTVKHYSVSAASYLTRILQDKELNYQKLIDATRHYYKTVSYPMTLMNYLEKEVWRGEYDNWNNGKSKLSIPDGSNRWESE